MSNVEQNPIDPSAPSYATRAEHEALVERVDATLRAHEETLKAREVSVPRALLTLAKDCEALRKGERKDFPLSSLQGAMFAWLRPRWTIVVGAIVGGIIGSALTIVQVRLLAQQNELIRLQGQLLESQTRATELAAVSGIVTGLAAREPQVRQTAIMQLGALGIAAYPILARMASSRDSLGVHALSALLEQGGLHSIEQVDGTLQAFVAKDIRFLSGGSHIWEFDQYLEALIARASHDAAFLDGISASIRDHRTGIAYHALRSSEVFAAKRILTSIWSLCHGLPVERGMITTAALEDSALSQYDRLANAMGVPDNGWSLSAFRIDGLIQDLCP